MIVDDSHFAYLSLQKGSLDHLRGDRAAWLAAYEASLADDLTSMMPYLPAKCESVLDIGSGLGGIDVLLNRHYGGGLNVMLLDGVEDAPEMTLHRHTFNNMRVAGDFLQENGVRDWGFYSPASTQLKNQYDQEQFGLIISLGSWCFHYPPLEYLSFVRNCCTASTVMIVDVRTDKPEWLAMLASQFIIVGCALSRLKFNRLVFRAA